MKVTAHCYSTGLEIKQEVGNAVKKSVNIWLVPKLGNFLDKLYLRERVSLSNLFFPSDLERLEERMLQRQPLKGSEYRAILSEIINILIEINAHLESGNRYYNALFERSDLY